MMIDVNMRRTDDTLAVLMLQRGERRDDILSVMIVHHGHRPVDNPGTADPHFSREAFANELTQGLGTVWQILSFDEGVELLQECGWYRDAETDQ